MPKISKYIPIVFSVIIVVAAATLVVIEKRDRIDKSSNKNKIKLEIVRNQQSCKTLPRFLKKLKISQPVLIDLTQRQYKGIAMHYGPQYNQSLHPKEWQKYENFSTYAADKIGNLYIVPTPFISIKPKTFELQKSLYKLDSETGVLAPFMFFNDIHPSSENPYGLSTIAYDCDDNTLWLAAIDESTYKQQKGVIYHLNPQTKEVLQKIDGVDALTMTIVLTKKGKFLLIGSARDNGLYAYEINKGVLSPSSVKLLNLPSANARIRKIKVKGRKQLELQSIPFGYSLIAQTENKYRTLYKVIWSNENASWKVSIIQ